MRPYRGKVIDSDRWVYGSLLLRGDKNPIIVADAEHVISDTWANHWHLNVPAQIVDKKTVGQFTDKQDKNGNDLYEGMDVKVDNVVGRIVYGGYWKYSAFGVETDNPLLPNDKPVTWDVLTPELAKDIEIIEDE